MQVGVIGDDEAGRQLTTELVQAGIDTTGVVVDHSRPTTTKTRIISRGSLRFPQQLARVDRLDRRPSTHLSSRRSNHISVPFRPG